MGDFSYVDTNMAATAAAQQEALYYWLLFKHQIRMSTGLLKSQYRRGENYLISINALISSLSILIPGKDTEPRVDLAKMLMYTKCRGRGDANNIVNFYCAGNKLNLKKNAKCLHVTNFHYSHPSKPISSDLETKLKKKYCAIAKELNFVFDKPNLQALETINADAQPTTTTSPMMSTAEYVTLINSSVSTVLSTGVLFDGLWSKSFEVQYGEFRRSDGSPLKTPFLVKSKSYFYYHDEVTMAQVVQINASPDSTLALMLILPDENISVEQYIHNMLTYESLKQIFKKMRTRANVHLSFPKFRLTASRQMAKPMQTLALKHNLELDRVSKPGKTTKYVAPVDDNVVLLQKVTINVQERGVDKKKTKSVSLFSREEVNFNADRPFIFALVTRGVVQQMVMLGVCDDPSRET